MCRLKETQQHMVRCAIPLVPNCCVIDYRDMCNKQSRTPEPRNACGSIGLYRGWGFVLYVSLPKSIPGFRSSEQSTSASLFRQHHRQECYMQGPLCCPKRALNSVVSPSGVWVPKAPLCCSQTWPAQPLSFDQGLMAYAAHEHHVGFEAPPCAENFAMRMSSACRCDMASGRGSSISLGATGPNR